MKKSIISLSVAAALGGFAGSASAQVPPAETLVFNATGVGHILYVPYFSTQEGNVTAINIVNTDTVRGKALKVRFRGASNSDDVYDFQVFLSPGDVWTAGISKNADGRSQLETSDNSCTLPQNVNGSFITSRISSKGGVAETREGYVEILNMGDIVDDTGGWSELYDTTKHEDGVPECDFDTLKKLKFETAASYLRQPTTGIMSNWTIINVAKKFAYSGAAAAIEARTLNPTPLQSGVPGLGNLVYWDQRSDPVSPAVAASYTADPLIVGGIISAAEYDLPDLSTPYVPNPLFPGLSAGCPNCQALLLSNAIAASEVAGEFYSEASVGGQTDWVISFPTRRYWAAVQYGTADKAVYNASTANVYFTSADMELGNSTNGGKAWQLCYRFGTDAVQFYDREETPTQSDDIVISPGTPLALSICGEVAVLGINNTAVAESATFGSVARSNVDNGFIEGWGYIKTPKVQGLPMLTQQFTRVNNNIDGLYYGLNYPARVVKKGLLAP